MKSNNWRTKKLETCCNVEYGTRVVKKRDGGAKYDVYGGGGKTFFMDVFNREDQLVVARFAMSEQCTRYVRGKFFLNDSGLTVDVKDAEELYQRFVDYYLFSINDYIYSISRGSAQRNLNVKQFRGLKIPIPPLPEQKRIVKILDKAFAAIDKAKANTEKNLANAQVLFESYSFMAFRNPGNWEKRSLGDVCHLYQGIAINAKTRHALVNKSNLPLLRIKDLKNNSVEMYIDPNNYPRNALVGESDLIYTRTGQIGLVFTGRKGVLHNNCFKIVPDNILSREFLFYWLQDPTFKARIISLASRAAQPDITHKLFKQQMIAIPSRSIQESIVKKLDNLKRETEKINKIYEHKLTKLDELRKSILKKAFAGEL